jgi:transcriptional regulator with XRE-family HTH domain
MDLNKAYGRDSPEDLAARLGSSLRALRIRQNWSQRELADRASVGLNVVKHLEDGDGATVGGLMRVLKAIGQAGWIETLAPHIGISPLQALKAADSEPRKRASPRRKR